MGQTSLAQCAAELGRGFVKLACGGLRDATDLRGHNRTWKDSQPGWILRELRRVGSKDPVFVLEEIDKLGASPAAVLLEVLDPAQHDDGVGRAAASPLLNVAGTVGPDALGRIFPELAAATAEIVRLRNDEVPEGFDEISGYSGCRDPSRLGSVWCGVPRCTATTSPLYLSVAGPGGLVESRPELRTELVMATRGCS